MTTPRLALAVIGCGIVARARYFPALQHLVDLYDVRALCDTDPDALTRAGTNFPNARRHNSLEDLLTHATDLNCAVLLITGDHSDPLDTLARHGIPTLTEKPIAYTHPAADRAAAAFSTRGVPLQVGYMKRQYETVHRLSDAIADGHATSIAIDLVHPPEDRYLQPVIGHGRDFSTDLPTYLDSETARPHIAAHLAALGVPADDLATRRAYVLLTTSVIHDINLIHGLAGEPEQVLHAHFWNAGLNGRISFCWSNQLTGSLTYSYVEVGSYEETIRVVGPRYRSTAHLPSPYLPHAPATLNTTSGPPGRNVGEPIEPLSFDDPFQRQLNEFHNVVSRGTAPTVNGSSAAADHALIDRIMRSAAAS
ncbi:MAG: Gfo/Idh/MocA family oxidoreductase [Nocardioides sp.]